MYFIYSILFWAALPAMQLGMTGPFMGTVSSHPQENAWRTCTTCDFPVWIALNSSPGTALVPQRHIYLFIQPVNFTEEKLKKVFEKFSKENPDPVILYITAFSNQQMLQQMIEAGKVHSYIEFMDTPEGKSEERKYYEKLYPAKTGCFQAYYYRSNNGEESFQYNPNPSINKYITITLKEKKKP